VKERSVPHPIQIPPLDAHNTALVANVHPPDWKNPTPDGRYNLVVIGAGTAGLITSLVAASLGAKVALVERHLMGGDCLNVGCVPSKAVIRAAHMAHEARGASRIGLGLPETRLPDFAAAMERMREIRARISHDDSAKRYREEFGVEIFFGDARFTGPRTVDVDGTTLEFAKAVITSGARASAPPVPGLAEAGYLDNETVFTLTERPRRLAVIGSGPIGCELAQAFRRLGSEVTLFELAPQILVREDPDAAAIVQDAFVREGIELVLGCTLKEVERRGAEKLVHLTCPKAGPRALAFDAILVGAGRAPNVEGMGLETVGVEYDVREGIHVDDFLRTTNPRIYAAGDCAMAWKFTHAADAAAKIVVQNALFSFGPLGKKRLSALVMPWCTYTDPEIAHVGLYERDAVARGIALDTYTVPISRANRATTDGQEEGLVKIHVKKGSAEIVGATVVAAHAGDLITQLTLAITQKIPLGAFTNVIYPYPTQGEAIKAAAGQYTRTRLTPAVKRLFAALMRLRR
jgi:pyruvate/2-oxoglutarate dehydrogenase complex dihydrolipoamide dehydrogenase (E3) component